MANIPVEITPLTIACAGAFGAAAAYFAQKRSKNPYMWFAIGFFFGLFGFCLLFFLPKARKKKAKTRLAMTPQEKPLPAIVGPSNKFWYYLDPQHLQQGPMSYEAITAALRQGKISPATYVWHEEMTDWKQVQELTKG